MTAPVVFDVLRSNFKDAILADFSSDSPEAVKTAVNEGNGSDPEKKLALDQAFRDAARSMLTSGKSTDDLTSVVTCAVNCARQDMCGQVLPFTLLSDILDCVTLDKCTDIFHYVDSHVDWWLEPRFYTSAGKNLLLRVCNNLLRRMSKPQNTVFCGRIQLFLAHLFPITEKSALNLTSQFNQDNVTEFKTAEEIEATSPANAMDTGDANESKIDTHVYQKLWSLQSFFSKPTDCYSHEKWIQFRGAVDHIVNVFVSHPLESHSVGSATSSATVDAEREALIGAAEPPSIPVGAEQQFYFPKYLTSEKLMDLELNDSNFRRQVLVQMLIVFQYLSGTVKFKAQSQVLSDSQDSWIKLTSDKIFDVLKKMPPNGEGFTSYVKQMLQREEHWVDWKNNSCPGFTRSREEFRNIQAPGREKKRSAARPQYTASKRIRWDLGSSELTRVWNINPDNLLACTANHRQFTPALADFFEEAIEQADPEAMVEDQYKVINESRFQWRALRLLSRHSPYFFVTPPNAKSSTARAVGPESIVAFLDQTVAQISKDSNTEQQRQQQSQPQSSQKSQTETQQQPADQQQQQPQSKEAKEEPEPMEDSEPVKGDSPDAVKDGASAESQTPVSASS